MELVIYIVFYKFNVNITVEAYLDNITFITDINLSHIFANIGNIFMEYCYKMRVFCKYCTNVDKKTFFHFIYYISNAIM